MKPKLEFAQGSEIIKAKRKWLDERAARSIRVSQEFQQILSRETQQAFVEGWIAAERFHKVGE